MSNEYRSADMMWLLQLDKLAAEGRRVTPRGKPTLELMNSTISCKMREPVVLSRKLNNRFLFGEAYWIMSGMDSVADIAPYMSRIADFSDDGQTFFGAYGPRYADQRQYVHDKLASDKDTRQAVMTFWRQNPPATKDYPCTIALVFSIRDSELHVSAIMRSNDIWLGTPYDIFNFSMIGLDMVASLRAVYPTLFPGRTSITAVSSHLYLENLKAAESILETERGQDTLCGQTSRSPRLQVPDESWIVPGWLLRDLEARRETGKLWNEV